jgi:murein L,D-transpeptidase YcbB/YkuD
LKRALQLIRSSTEGDSDKAVQAVKVALNMERWRWEKQWPSRYIYVNVPGFILRVKEEDSVWLESTVIVGKRAPPTPVPDGVIRSFTIYPYWHAPYRIATKEIVPALQRDASYLQRNNFEVLNRAGSVIWSDTIQWELYDEHHFRTARVYFEM